MRDALVLGAALALLSASAAPAQESSRLSAEYLGLATLLIHWPQGLEPRSVDVFVHNVGWIGAPPEIVWANLIDASQWPNWCSNSADVRIDGDQRKLAKGVSFTWKTFNFPLPSTVDVFEPGREIGWSVDNPGSVFITPGCWSLSAAGPASSQRKRRRAPTRSNSGSRNRTQCMTPTIGGCPR